MASPQQIRTPLTDLLNITHPIMLAGMNVAGPKLAAAVTNAGGIGVIGGYGYTPDMLREQIRELKSSLVDKSAPFGVDLLIPQVGGNARKTNYDYTKGKLDELITIIIENGAKLFVSAVGIPPKRVVDRLHQHGVLYMNMIGHPKHVAKCLANDVDILGAQAGEGGGHTGDVPISILVPAVAELVKDKKSALTGKDVQVVAAGAISNGYTLAAALMLGASAVWVGTRFVMADESKASPAHREAIQTAGFDDTIRTVIFSGRPMRVRKTPYIVNWEQNRQDEIKTLTANGIRPVDHDAEQVTQKQSQEQQEEDIMDNLFPFLMGSVAAVIQGSISAKAIVDEMVRDAAERLAVARGMAVEGEVVAKL